MRRLLLPLLAATLAIGCVYPRRGTSLTPVRAERSSGSLSAPADVWKLTVVDAQVRPRRAGDLHWDDDQGLPDVFVRVYRDEALIFETETVQDSLTPTFDASPAQNVRLPAGTPLRFEVWDADTVGADPVGIHRTNGLPQNAVPDADARIMLEGGSWLTIRITAPRAHRGVGIAEYEVRPDALVVVRVEPHSPAGRAGIEPGDAIVAVGDERVSELNEAQAASALSMAANRSRQLTVRNAQGRERQVDLDQGYVWLTL
ncbi:MAG: PDZ domain-containing protein [Myxococcota bacterium]|nr:PDZ domain-containing protein [Myxococcota bacterium]